MLQVINDKPVNEECKVIHSEKSKSFEFMYTYTTTVVNAFTQAAQFNS